MDKYRILRVAPGSDRDVAYALGHTALFFTHPGTDKPLFPGYLFHNALAPRPHNIRGTLGYMVKDDTYLVVTAEQLRLVHEYVQTKLSAPTLDPLTEYLGPTVSGLLWSAYHVFAPPIGTIEFQDVVAVQRFGKVRGAPHRVARPTFTEALAEYRRVMH